jgi:hypothetical protein
VKNCSDLYSKNELQQRYGFIIPLDLFLCPDHSAGAKIKNYWGKDDYYSIIFSVTRYKNTTFNTGNPCLPLEEINSMIQLHFILLL